MNWKFWKTKRSTEERLDLIQLGMFREAMNIERHRKKTPEYVA